MVLSIRITIKTVPNTHSNVISVEKRTYQEIRQVFGSFLCLYKNNVDVRDLTPFPSESVRFKIQKNIQIAFFQNDAKKKRKNVCISKIQATYIV